MSLPHAILTALLEKPSSGLELTRRFDRSIGYFWSSTHQQIYRELGKLEQAGRIRALPTAAPARGQKKEYEVLPAGREELAAWVAVPEDPRPVRDPLLLRMRAAAVVGTHGMGPELGRHLALHERQLAEYQEIEERDFTPLPTTDEGRLRHLVLRGGIDLETFWIGWLTRAIADLDTA
ncbi:PadR family transcriptional regulator [Streptomyces rubiginosohelvolus]